MTGRGRRRASGAAAPARPGHRVHVCRVRTGGEEMWYMRCGDCGMVGMAWPGRARARDDAETHQAETQ